MNDLFRYLFTPMRIGSIEVPNRIVCLPHATGFGQDGHPTEKQVYYLADRARGGAGLIIMAGGSVHPTAVSHTGYFAAHNVDNIPRFKAIADAVHEHGAKIVGQILHEGRQTTSFFSQRPVWALSPIPCPIRREMPHEMNDSEILEVIQHFARSASNYEAAGLDGVELHAAHGYLLQQSMSPWSNRRTDEYGGSLENRLKLINEVIDAIRVRVASSFVLGVRISGDELVQGGLTLDDMTEIAKNLEATGKIDYISVALATAGRYVLDMSAPPGSIVYMAAGIREVVGLPVIASQRINDVLLAEKILEDGHADLIGMARALICDPELPNKAKEGRLDDIRTCVACLQECRRTAKGAAISCIQNPTVGHEKEKGIGSIRRAAAKKKVLVIGGGPGGLETARVAALRGHDVYLWEKDSKLGGQVNIAALAPNREEIGGVVRYLSRQVEKLGVRISLGKEANLKTVLDERPDAVVVSTGSVPLVPSLEGADGLCVVSVWDVLQARVDVGGKVVVVDGGESFWQCCSAAEFLANRGKKVEMISGLHYCGFEIPPESLGGLYQRFARTGVVLSPLSSFKRVEGSSLIVGHVFSGEEREISGVDTVVLATGNKACDELYRSLKGNIAESYAVGDCVAPRKIADAIREGNFVGRDL